MGWYGNLDSSMVKSARLEIWRSVVQIPVQVQIFLLKNLICKKYNLLEANIMH